MSKSDDLKRLLHIQEFTRKAIDTLEGTSREEFKADETTHWAIVKYLEIIGEAAGKVSESGRSRFKDFPWSDLISLRNRPSHGYESIDWNIIWEIVSG